MSILRYGETPDSDPRRLGPSTREKEHNQCNPKGWLGAWATDPELQSEFQQKLRQRAHLRRPGPRSGH